MLCQTETERCAIVVPQYSAANDELNTQDYIPGKIVIPSTSRQFKSIQLNSIALLRFHTQPLHCRTSAIHVALCLIYMTVPSGMICTAYSCSIRVLSRRHSLGAFIHSPP